MLIQDTFIFLRKIIPRGWSPLLRGLALLFPSLKKYSASLSDSSIIYLDLSQRMCHGIFFNKGQPHEMGTDKIISSCLNNGDYFIDVGANIGYYTCMAARIVGAGGKVFALEPQDKALDLLKLNCNMYGQIIDLIPKAASESSGVVTFYIREMGDTSSMIASANARKADVESIALDDLMIESGKLKLIKIDVEGAELSVLRGAKNLIAKQRPWICLEYLDETSEKGILVDDFLQFFDPIDYECRWVDQSNGSSLVSNYRSSYILASPKSDAFRVDNSAEIQLIKSSSSMV